MTSAAGRSRPGAETKRSWNKTGSAGIKGPVSAFFAACQRRVAEKMGNVPSGGGVPERRGGFFALWRTLLVKCPKAGGGDRAAQAGFREEAAHLRTGRLGESLAASYLKKAGLKIVARNVRVGRDEFDLIAWQGATLVFVEVKTRSGDAFGRPAAAVNRKKRLNLSRAAVRFLKKRNLQPARFRFDIVEVVGESRTVRHLPNAFPLEGGYRIWW